MLDSQDPEQFRGKIFMHFFPRKLGPAALNLNLETVIPKP